MKVIIFSDSENQIYLHINKITKVRIHKYDNFTRTEIHTGNYQTIIQDYQHKDFNKLIQIFIRSNEKLKIIKIKNIVRNTNAVHLTLADWVSEAMG